MTRILALLAALVAGTGASAQTPAAERSTGQTQAAQTSAAQLQKGIGETGTMYDGNNLVRFPLAQPPSPNPASPADAAPGVTGAQGSRDESGNGAGGGEH